MPSSTRTASHGSLECVAHGAAQTQSSRQTKRPLTPVDLAGSKRRRCSQATTPGHKEALSRLTSELSSLYRQEFGPMREELVGILSEDLDVPKEEASAILEPDGHIPDIKVALKEAYKEKTKSAKNILASKRAQHLVRKLESWWPYTIQQALHFYQHPIFATTTGNTPDVRAFTPLEFSDFIERGDVFSTPVLLRDTGSLRKDDRLAQEFFAKLRAEHSEHELEVQDYSSETVETQRWTVPAVLDRLQHVDTVSDEMVQPPINLLDMRAIVEISTESLDFLNRPRFELLPRLLRSLEDTGPNKPASGYRSGSSPTRSTTVHTDISDRLKFNLYAQRGAFSAPHADLLGGTFITVLSGLKAWAFVPSPSDAESDAFARFGQQWKPSARRIRTVMLGPGDTLVMPAGCVHMPLTVEPALCFGGIFWDCADLTNTLKTVERNVRSPDCTNELPARQLPALLEQLQACARAGEDILGVPLSLLDSMVVEVKDAYRKRKLSCRHANECAAFSRSRKDANKCPCFRAGKECTPWCSRASQRKKNKKVKAKEATTNSENLSIPLTKANRQYSVCNDESSGDESSEDNGHSSEPRERIDDHEKSVVSKGKVDCVSENVQEIAKTPDLHEQIHTAGPHTHAKQKPTVPEPVLVQDLVLKVSETATVGELDGKHHADGASRTPEARRVDDLDPLATYVRLAKLYAPQLLKLPQQPLGKAWDRTAFVTGKLRQ